ncbi:MAG: protein arginine kinase [Firmicutes bacterium]|nr:protein arginine kinase [Bacillota bacterium]
MKSFGQNLSRWMDGEAPHSTVVISSRMRLARNFGEFTFPGQAEEGQLDEVQNQIRRWWNNGGLKGLGETKFVSIKELPASERQALVDKHLVSPALIKNPGAAIVNADESVSIMINEEDHLRIQALLPGLQLAEAWQAASDTDDLFDARFRYAWSPERGFLTSCPTNVGTGMRASVMLHLPGLALNGSLNQVLGAVGKLGFAVRGMYGEGSEAQGNIYQVSNQVTLGQSEEQITEALNRVALQIIRHELDSREQLVKNSENALADRVWRAYGVLAHARTIESREAMELISNLRLGIDLELISGIKPQIFNELLVFIRAGYLQKIFGRELAPRERDMYRAQLIRESLVKQ